LAIYTALALRHGELIITINQAALISIAATTLLIFTRTELYRAAIRYMASKDFGTLAMGITVSALILTTSSFITQASLPRSSYHYLLAHSVRTTRLS